MQMPMTKHFCTGSLLYANTKRTCWTMNLIPNPVDALATGLRVVTGISLDVVSFVGDAVFQDKHKLAILAKEVAPERTVVQSDANLYDIADSMLDGT